MKHLTALMILLTATAWSCVSQNENQSKTAPEEEKQETPAVSNSEIYREFYPDSALKIEGRQVNGQREGKWTSYYPNGLKWSETTFRAGVKDGPTITYYESGIMRYSGQYYNDYKTGIWQFYNEEGKLDKTVDLTPQLNNSLESDSAAATGKPE
jgi:antitoxin component YwqK of YwqJK toxin-antitoxin module